MNPQLERALHIHFEYELVPEEGDSADGDDAQHDGGEEEIVEVEAEVEGPHHCCAGAGEEAVGADAGRKGVPFHFFQNLFRKVEDYGVVVAFDSSVQDTDEVAVALMKVVKLLSRNQDQGQSYCWWIH